MVSNHCPLSFFFNKCVLSLEYWSLLRFLRSVISQLTQGRGGTVGCLIGRWTSAHGGERLPPGSGLRLLSAVSIPCHQGNLKGLMPAHLKWREGKLAHFHSSRQLFSRRHLWLCRLHHTCNYDESSQLRWSRKIKWKETKTIQRGKKSQTTEKT